MARRSEKRDAAKTEYCARRAKGEKINLREFSEEMGASYDLCRRWKIQDKWEDAVPRKRGGQPGNKNSKGHKNAKGNHGGAPKQNKNAEKDGAYSTIFFNCLSAEDRTMLSATPTDSGEHLRLEMAVLKLREKKILDKIAEYEARPDDELYLTSQTDIGKTPMRNKETPFVRVQKLQEALYKVQGRIAAVANAMRQAEESERRFALEERKLELARMRATGEVEIDDETVHEQGDSGLS